MNKFLALLATELSTDALKAEYELERAINSTKNVEVKLAETKVALETIAINELSRVKLNAMTQQPQQPIVKQENQ